MSTFLFTIPSTHNLLQWSNNVEQVKSHQDVIITRSAEDWKCVPVERSQRPRPVDAHVHLFGQVQLRPNQDWKRTLPHQNQSSPSSCDQPDNQSHAPKRSRSSVTKDQPHVQSSNGGLYVSRAGWWWDWKRDWWWCSQQEDWGGRQDWSVSATASFASEAASSAQIRRTREH